MLLEAFCLRIYIFFCCFTFAKIWITSMLGIDSIFLLNQAMLAVICRA